jgi:MFS family permease
MISGKPSATPAEALKRDAFIWFLFANLGLFGFMQGYLSAAMPFVREAHALSPSVVAWHFSAYALGRLTSGFPAAAIVGRKTELGAIRLVAAGLVATMVGMALSGHGLAYWVGFSIALAFAIGFCGGLLQALVQAQIGGLPGRTRELALGEAYVWAGLGVFLCPILIGWTAQKGYPWGLALAAPTLVLAALFVLSLPATRSAHVVRDARDSSHNIFAVVAFWCLVVLGNAVEWGLGLWGPQFLQVRHGLATADAVSLMSLYFGSTIAGRMINARLLRRFESDQLFVAYLLVGWAAVLAVLLSDSLAIVITALMCAGAALGCLYPSNMSTAMKYAPGQIVRITAGAAKCSGFSLLVIPLLIGYASDRWGLVTAILVLGGIPPIMLAVVAIVRRGSNADAARS